jgi:hypothetical protein
MPASPSAKTQFPLEKFQEFSALMVGSMIPSDDREWHVYRSGKLMRTPGPEGRNFIITNLSTQESYGVAATGCMHDRHAHVLSAPFSFIGLDYGRRTICKAFPSKCNFCGDSDMIR